MGWSQVASKSPLQTRGDTRPCPFPSRPNRMASSKQVNNHTLSPPAVTASQIAQASPDLSSVMPPVIQLPPPSVVHARTPGVALLPALVVSESPLPHIPAQTRSLISRLTDAIKSTVPTMKRNNSMKSVRTFESGDYTYRMESHFTGLTCLGKRHLDSRNTSVSNLFKRLPLLFREKVNPPLEKTKVESSESRLPFNLSTT